MSQKPAIHFDAQNPTQPQPCCRDCTCRQVKGVASCLAGYVRLGFDNTIKRAVVAFWEWYV